MYIVVMTDQLSLRAMAKRVCPPTSLLRVYLFIYFLLVLLLTRGRFITQWWLKKCGVSPTCYSGFPIFPRNEHPSAGHNSSYGAYQSAHPSPFDTRRRSDRRSPWCHGWHTQLPPHSTLSCPSSTHASTKSCLQPLAIGRISQSQPLRQTWIRPRSRVGDVTV